MSLIISCNYSIIKYEKVKFDKNIENFKIGRINSPNS